MNRRRFMLAGVAAAGPRALRSQSRWQPDGLASIARIGVVTPDDDPVPESEMVTLAPKGVSIHASRVPWNHEVSVLVERAPAAVEMLARVSPRIILYAFTSSSYALGVQGHDELRAKLEKSAGGIPVFLTCDAAVEGFRSLSARRVALFHPPWFAEDITRKGSDYFRARGLDVVYCGRLRPARAFAEVPAAEVYEWVRSRAPSQAEAIFIAGNGLRAIGVIYALEEILRKPVLTANQVLFWKALTTLRVRVGPDGYGSLFSTTSRAR